MQNIIKCTAGATGAVVSYFFGGWTMLLQTLVIFIALDYVFGVLTAAYLGELNSKKGFKGIAKKAMIFMIVAVAHLLDQVIGSGYFIRDAVICFYIANEVISIVESASKTNLPIPDKLKKIANILIEGEIS